MKKVRVLFMMVSVGILSVSLFGCVKMSPSDDTTSTPAPTSTQTTASVPTSSQTPTQTPTQTPAQTPTQAPSQTPTQTPSQTPAQTPTQTPAQASAPTPTPTQGEFYGDTWLYYSANRGRGGYTVHLAFNSDNKDDFFEYEILGPERRAINGETGEPYVEIIVSREGYTFKCWNTKPNGTGTSYYPGQRLSSEEFGAMLDESFTLYAIWEKNE